MRHPACKWPGIHTFVTFIDPREEESRVIPGQNTSSQPLESPESSKSEQKWCKSDDSWVTPFRTRIYPDLRRFMGDRTQKWVQKRVQRRVQKWVIPAPRVVYYPARCTTPPYPARYYTLLYPALLHSRVHHSCCASPCCTVCQRPVCSVSGRNSLGSEVFYSLGKEVF